MVCRECQISGCGMATRASTLRSHNASLCSSVKGYEEVEWAIGPASPAVTTANSLRSMPKKIADEIASKPKLYAALLVAHLIVTSLTWRDLRNRSVDEVRGPKRLWRVASAANMGNSVAYVLFGRKQAT
jgi:hypothetical protein